MYIHTTQAASLLAISSRRLRKLLAQGRVIGAYKSGKLWLIPLHNEMPVIKKAKRGQAGTWKTGKNPSTRRLEMLPSREPLSPSKSIIHINSHRIKQNINKSPEERQPPIAIKGVQLGYVERLEIPAPCTIIYSPDKPLSCGARVWIEVFGVNLELIAS